MARRRIVYMPLAEIGEAERNPKSHAVEAIGASVDRFGVIEPIALDERTGRLVSGHGRLADFRRRETADGPLPDGVIVKAGVWLAPVVRGWASKDDDDALAALVAVNQVGPKGGWVDHEIVDVLRSLQASERGFDGVGFDSGDLDRIVADLTRVNPWTDRPMAAMPDARGCTVGEVWQVGSHRLVVGDSRDPACWAVLPKAGMLLTDPPYGIAYGGGGGLAREAIDDDADPSLAANLLDVVLDRAAAGVEPGAGSYVFLPGGTPFPVLLTVVARHGLHRWSLVWVKDQATFGRADFHQRHEHISYGWFPGPRRVPVEDRTLNTVWEEPRPRRSEHHPTEKPVALLRRAIEASSRPGDVIVDPFAGSGSTLVAAAETGRIGVGIERRPEYARVTLDRLAEATGQEPTRLDHL